MIENICKTITFLLLLVLLLLFLISIYITATITANINEEEKGRITTKQCIGEDQETIIEDSFRNT